jgi:hypothetical protein
MYSTTSSGFKHLPGYTGHIPSGLEQEEGVGRSEARNHIPGYQGYIPSVKAENLYGQTYGKISYTSAAQDFPKGMDVDPSQKYKSVQKEQFINLSSVKEPTAGEILGVQRSEENKQPVIPVETANKFWGVQNQDLEFNENLMKFYGKDIRASPPPPSGQDFTNAQKVFFGVEKKEKPVKNGEPIPGYTGVSRRVVADNIFGMTYANSRKLAKDELKEQKDEKSQILQQRAIFIPEYRR